MIIWECAYSILNSENLKNSVNSDSKKGRTNSGHELMISLLSKIFYITKVIIFIRKLRNN